MKLMMCIRGYPVDSQEAKSEKCITSDTCCCIRVEADNHIFWIEGVLRRSARGVVILKYVLEDICSCCFTL